MLKEITLFLKGNPHTTVICFAKTTAAWVWSFSSVSSICLAENEYIIGTGSQSLRIYYFACGVGSFLVLFALGQMLKNKSQENLKLLLCISFCISLVGIIFSAWVPHPILFFIISGPFRNGGDTAIFIFSMTILQTSVSNTMLGRVIALDIALCTFAEACGDLVAGALMDYAKWNEHHVLWMMTGFQALNICIWIIVYIVYKRRSNKPKIRNNNK